MTAAESKQLVDEARRAGVVTAVTFNYRGNPLVQQARSADRARRHRHAALRPRPLPAGLAAQRHRLLLASRSGERRRVVGARRHRLALVRPGAARDRPAHHARARRHHDRASRSGRSRAARARRSRPARRAATWTSWTSRVEDLASVLVRFENGAKGTLLGRPGVRRPQERSRARGVRLDGVGALAAGAPERAVDRPSRPRQRGAAEGPVAPRRGRTAVRAPAGRPPGGVGRRLLQPDARDLRRASPPARRIARCRRSSRRSKTATAPTGSWRRFSRAPTDGGVWTHVTS